MQTHKLTFRFAVALDPSNSMAGTDESAAPERPLPLLVDAVKVAVLRAALCARSRRGDDTPQSSLKHLYRLRQRGGRWSLWKRTRPNRSRTQKAALLLTRFGFFSALPSLLS